MNDVDNDLIRVLDFLSILLYKIMIFLSILRPILILQKKTKNSTNFDTNAKTLQFD